MRFVSRFLTDGKTVLGCLFIFFTRPEHDRRELRLIGRVRAPLRFKTDAAVFTIYSPRLSVESVRQEVGCVDLQSGLGGEYFQQSPGITMIQSRCRIQFAGDSIQQKIMVVSATATQDLVIDPRPDLSGPGKIQRGIRRIQYPPVGIMDASHSR